MQYFYFMKLKETPYHLKVKNHFFKQSKTWDFFAASKNKENQLAQFKSELLKNTYKFDEATDLFIYDKIKTAKEKLHLETLSVTVYQAEYTEELNASILYVNNEAHIVFSGGIIKLMDKSELLSVLAHELAHVKLYSMLDGSLEIADRIITAIANNYNSDAVYVETARLYRLYTEIFCDRGAYEVVGKIEPIITSLVKANTGLDSVNAVSYLKQVEEIFASEKGFKSSNVTHPENFIRAKAIQLWHDKQEAAEDEIIRMIEGIVDIDQLDIFAQKELSDLTMRFLQLYLKPKWFHSTMVLSQAKQYFTDFSLDEKVVLDEKLILTLEQAHVSVKEYLSYVLMDFAMLDATLEEVPSGWSFQFAEDLQLKETYDQVIKKELNFSDKKLKQYKQKMLDAYYDVKENEGEQIYDG